MKERYFPNDPAAPPPLRVTVARRVRFEEADPLGIVWHGRYASYFEDARERLGDTFGIGYMAFFSRGFSIPIRRFTVDYLNPLAYPDELGIEAILHWSEAMRLNYEFIIRARGIVCATGCCVHLMVKRDGRDRAVQLTVPDFYREILDRWRAGELNLS